MTKPHGEGHRPSMECRIVAAFWSNVSQVDIQGNILISRTLCLYYLFPYFLKKPGSLWDLKMKYWCGRKDSKSCLCINFNYLYGLIRGKECRSSQTLTYSGWVLGWGWLVNSAGPLSTVRQIYEKCIRAICLSKAFSHIETQRICPKCREEKLFKSAIIM